MAFNDTKDNHSILISIIISIIYIIHFIIKIIILDEQIKDDIFTLVVVSLATILFIYYEKNKKKILNCSTYGFYCVVVFFIVLYQTIITLFNIIFSITNSDKMESQIYTIFTNSRIYGDKYKKYTPDELDDFLKKIFIIVIIFQLIINSIMIYFTYYFHKLNKASKNACEAEGPFRRIEEAN
ncbi:hypothetical protein BCR32DRAFT_304166 [Anaeromyces robustus]|uniref:Uncharacterized protein n=1 Tax=Anaeromyces robustus TaxID=1754192 RepID=A0A1Y1XK10_9FUNG|nr:hypothetical protein BCR32DRAFT_304166 [Anaeromyces robustus]|eukprot:ORX85684.1 hypothetical protein BCR32DRAFT_304166 [Anaeromyces robustus]